MTCPDEQKPAKHRYQMNATQLNKISAFLTVRDVLANVIPANANPALPSKVNAYNQKLDELTMLAKQQSQPLSSSIADRDQTLEAAVRATLIVAGALLSYADEQKLASLANRMRVRAAGFRKVRTLQQVQLPRQVYDAVGDGTRGIGAIGRMCDRFGAPVEWDPAMRTYHYTRESLLIAHDVSAGWDRGRAADRKMFRTSSRVRSGGVLADCLPCQPTR
jgi:hypothetical protein